jgi:release factor glutamine methyltransferase
MSTLLSAWIKTAQARLQSAGIATARLDCLVLTEDILNTNRTQILADTNRELTEVELQKLDNLIAKRAKHIPLAYLRQKTEFYGREFYVDEHVLEPRPESETMIDLLKALRLSKAKLADIGSGSGALGVTAKLEMPDLDVTLTEIDSDALTVSKHNANMHHVSVQILRSDLLDGMHEHFDVLLCNLPYVPDGFHINLATTHEPRVAIFGGKDGLDLYRRLFTQVGRLNHAPSYILTEAMPPQHQGLALVAADASYRLHASEDFIQVFAR